MKLENILRKLFPETIIQIELDAIDGYINYNNEIASDLMNDYLEEDNDEEWPPFEEEEPIEILDDDDDSLEEEERNDVIDLYSLIERAKIIGGHREILPGSKYLELRSKGYICLTDDLAKNMKKYNSIVVNHLTERFVIDDYANFPSTAPEFMIIN